MRWFRRIAKTCPTKPSPKFILDGQTLSCAVHCTPRLQGEAGVPCIQASLGVDASGVQQMLQQAKVSSWDSRKGLSKIKQDDTKWHIPNQISLPPEKNTFVSRYECKFAHCFSFERRYLRIITFHNFSSPSQDKSPCIVCINEIDAIGRQRVDDIGGRSDEPEQTLYQKLGGFRWS